MQPRALHRGAPALRAGSLPSQPACVPRHRCSGLTPRTCPRQAQTECAAYKRDADYPVDPALQAECSLCKRWLTVPDVPARRRDHCLATFSCAALGASAGPRVPRWLRWPNAPGRRSSLASLWLGSLGRAAGRRLSPGPCLACRLLSRVGQQCGAVEPESGDDDDDDAPLRVRLRAAFAELIDDPAGLIGDMAPCGPRASTQGDAIIGLPTLVHRGPGTMGLAADAAGRCVCFFTIRPKFHGERAALNNLGTYDADSQACYRS